MLTTTTISDRIAAVSFGLRLAEATLFRPVPATPSRGLSASEASYPTIMLWRGQRNDIYAPHSSNSTYFLHPTPLRT